MREEIAKRFGKCMYYQQIISARFMKLFYSGVHPAPDHDTPYTTISTRSRIPFRPQQNPGVRRGEWLISLRIRMRFEIKFTSLLRRWLACLHWGQITTLSMDRRTAHGGGQLKEMTTIIFFWSAATKSDPLLVLFGNTRIGKIGNGEWQLTLRQSNDGCIIAWKEISGRILVMMWQGLSALCAEAVPFSRLNMKLLTRKRRKRKRRRRRRTRRRRRRRTSEGSVEHHVNGSHAHGKQKRYKCIHHTRIRISIESNCNNIRNTHAFFKFPLSHPGYDNSESCSSPIAALTREWKNQTPDHHRSPPPFRKWHIRFLINPWDPTALPVSQGFWEVVKNSFDVLDLDVSGNKRQCNWQFHHKNTVIWRLLCTFSDNWETIAFVIVLSRSWMPRERYHSKSFSYLLERMENDADRCM